MIPEACSHISRSQKLAVFSFYRVLEDGQSHAWTRSHLSAETRRPYSSLRSMVSSPFRVPRELNTTTSTSKEMK